jgi:hypothetical protein
VVPVRIQFGDLQLAPTETEETIAAVAGGAVVVGQLVGSSMLKAIGLLALAGVCYAVYEEAQTFADPDTMNGYFQTGGALSATNGANDAAALRARGYQP